MKTQTVPISKVKTNPNNPRLIKDDKFKKLVKSIQEFPKMLELRPIVVNSEMIVLGGNMRLKACKEAGLKEVTIVMADDLSEDEQKQFIIKDNVSFGEYDWDMLANEWDSEQLGEWGVDVPTFDNPQNDFDYSGKNKEIDIDNLDKDMTINLKYTEEDYHIVKEQFSKLGGTPEQIVWKLLGNE